MDLRLAQARYRFGLASGEDLTAAAQHLVEGGSDNPTACELACLHRPTVRDASPLFERVARELGISDLPAAEARDLVAADIARAILAGTVPPRRGLMEIEALQCASEGLDDVWPSDPWRFYDDGWPDDPEECAARHAEVDKSVLEAARTMLERLPRELQDR